MLPVYIYTYLPFRRNRRHFVEDITKNFLVLFFPDTVYTYLQFVRRRRVIKFNKSCRLIDTLARVTLVYNEYLTAQHRHDHVSRR